MNRRLISILVVIVLVAISAAVGAAIGRRSPAPVTREITIKARQYAYEPNIIRVNRGDTLRIKLVSLDVMHGFFVEGYDIDARISANKIKFEIRHPSRNEEWTEVEELVLITDRTGKFRYRCSHTCGTMHPFMLGELVVEPNTPYHASVGAMIGIFLGMLGSFALRIRSSATEVSPTEEP